MLLYEFSILFHPHKLGWVFVVNTLLLLVYVAVIIYNERALVKRTLSGLQQKMLHR